MKKLFSRKLFSRRIIPRRTYQGTIIPFFLIVLLLLPSVAAYADLIYEPYNNDFYNRHKSECVHMNRSFIANGPKGYVAIYSEPNGKALGGTENDSVFRVNFTYDYDGVIWGIVTYSVSDAGDATLVPGGYGSDGWVRMSDMILRYDYISFEEEHADRIEDTYVNYDILGEGLSQLCLYEYPGGGLVHTIKPETEYPEMNIHVLTKSYVGDGGRTWAYGAYNRGIRNYWVCLTDPENENLPVTDIKYDDVVQKAKVPSDVVNSMGKDDVAIKELIPIMLAILGCVAVTAVLIRVFWKKKAI